MLEQEPQSTGAVLMVRPARFGYNAETAASNAFQQWSEDAPHTPDPALEGLREFDALVLALRRAGISVFVADDTAEPAKPDALFPNNWVSFHRDGSVVLYPMLAPNRRAERREEVIEQVRREGAFRITRRVDLTHREAESRYLEGTGSLVLDRVARTAYACLSPRTDFDVLGEFAQRLDYELVSFEAVDALSRPIYHTNVLMAIGAQFAVVCAEAIGDPAQRASVLSRLRATGHEIVMISHEQMRRFAGNLLELEGAQGRVIALSTTAWAALDAGQRAALEKQAAIVAVPIPTIERLGGGGVRCMLAEIHLPTRGPQPLS
jgi:hypothetical protein